jgi:hypothetical protein
MKVIALLALALTGVHSFTSVLPSARTPFRTSAGVRQSMKMAAGGSEYEYALLFDCDGVILETEEFHRLAYNAAFEAAELTIDGKPVNWSVEYYDVLQNTVGELDDFERTVVGGHC